MGGSPGRVDASCFSEIPGVRAILSKENHFVLEADIWSCTLCGFNAVMLQGPSHSVVPNEFCQK